MVRRPHGANAGKIIAPFGGQSRGIPPEIGPFWQFEYYDADSPEEIRAAVDEAHRAGRPVAAHVIGGEAADNVIAGAVDSIEH